MLTLSHPNKFEFEGASYASSSRKCRPCKSVFCKTAGAFTLSASQTGIRIDADSCTAVGFAPMGKLVSETDDFV